MRNALTTAQQIAGTSGRRRPAGRPHRDRAAETTGSGGYSGAGPDPARDPQPLGAVFAEYATEREWDRPIAQGRVFADWAGLVGPEVAAHCAPRTLNAGELRIAAESTAWATQLRLLGSNLLARLVAELGPDVVTRLVITGPTAPSWKRGAWSVRGGRGPRDTYG